MGTIDGHTNKDGTRKRTEDEHTPKQLFLYREYPKQGDPHELVDEQCPLEIAEPPIDRPGVTRKVSRLYELEDMISTLTVECRLVSYDLQHFKTAG